MFIAIRTAIQCSAWVQIRRFWLCQPSVSGHSVTTLTTPMASARNYQ